MIKDLVPLIQKITEGQDLSAAEAEKAFLILEGEDEENYFYFTLLASLHTKGETGDELLGFCRANEHFVPSFITGIDADKIIDLSGTGGDKIKTPNVSTPASFIVASSGLAVAKQAFFAVTGILGSADLMQNFGVDPLSTSQQGPDRVREILAKTGMVIYHANSMANPETRRGYFTFWLKRVPATGLAFVTAYHLAANAYSPIPMKRRIYGVFSDKYLRPLAEVFQKLGYHKGLVFHGVDGLDEMSVVGPTKVAEFSATGIKEYTITPSDVGLRTARVDDIRGASKEANLRDFMRILYGKENGPKRDLILLNAAAAFYAMDEVGNLKEGVALAASLVDDGKASRKLEEYVQYCGDLSKLDALKKHAAV